MSEQRHVSLGTTGSSRLHLLTLHPEGPRGWGTHVDTERGRPACPGLCSVSEWAAHGLPRRTFRTSPIAQSKITVRLSRCPVRPPRVHGLSPRLAVQEGAVARSLQ